MSDLSITGTSASNNSGSVSNDTVAQSAISAFYANQAYPIHRVEPTTSAAWKAAIDFYAKTTYPSGATDAEKAQLSALQSVIKKAQGTADENTDYSAAPTVREAAQQMSAIIESINWREIANTSNLLAQLQGKANNNALQIVNNLAEAESKVLKNIQEADAEDAKISRENLEKKAQENLKKDNLKGQQDKQKEAESLFKEIKDNQNNINCNSPFA
ncbi:MAG: hypothetical protein A2007_05245 [Verrucomicrobia bacterium GWC2_42_7]|nr:MAG: hypothetical protein A2007_05245 [Verrucomicrobia bacterium GWC2_42_7]